MVKLSKLITFIFTIVFTNYSYVLENNEEILKNENNFKLEISNYNKNEEINTDEKILK